MLCFSVHKRFTKPEDGLGELTSLPTPPHTHTYTQNSLGVTIPTSHSVREYMRSHTHVKGRFNYILHLSTEIIH